MLLNQKPMSEDEEIMPGRAKVTELGLPVKRVGTPDHHRTERLREQWWHRTAEILRASGWGVLQIAQHLGMSKDAVYDIDRTSWFQASVAKLIEERVGANDVLALARECSIDAHRVIVKLMNDPAAGPRVQLQAATTIMDRVFGKPLQKVEMDNTIRSADPVAEVERLKKEKLDLQMRVGDVNG